MSLTLQQIFNRVAKHLLTQKQRCVRSPNDAGLALCAYRNESGLACAVGALIPDKLYKPIMDNGGDTGIAANKHVQRALVKAGVMSSTRKDDPAVPLLHDLQCLHDSNTPGYWPRGLHEVAKEHGLNTTVLKRLAT